MWYLRVVAAAMVDAVFMAAAATGGYLLINTVRKQRLLNADAAKKEA